MTSRSSATAEEKIAALQSAGVRVELDSARSEATADGDERCDAAGKALLYRHRI
jgi:hypothetical protein